MALTPISRKPMSFVLPVVALAGAFGGQLVGTTQGNTLIGIAVGAALLAGLAYGFMNFDISERLARWGTAVGLVVIGGLFAGLPGLVVGAIFGYLFGWFIYWIGEGRYRQHISPYATAGQVLWHHGFRFICGLVFFFLIAPIVVVMPLSFNAQDFFTFTPEMLQFKAEGFSLKHYQDFFTFTPEMLQFKAEGFSLKHYQDFFSSESWQRSLKNSIIIAPLATIISVSLGTLAAVGLSQSHVPFKRAIMAILISPMIVPLIISATGMFFFYSTLGNWMEGTLGLGKGFVGYVKVVLAHAVLGIPFVIITVTATLVGFDNSLTRASANMGAGPLRTFFKVQMPLILPGVISGALFAFITSFDEVVVVLFVGSAAQKTLPWQMFIGLREQISPTILAVATILVALSILLLASLEMLRRRSERLRGMSPG
jgi:putative spermidine/putrescine transport system permease protein